MCYAAKTSAVFDKERAKAEKKGLTIVEDKKAAKEFFPHGSGAPYSKTHVELDQACEQDEKSRSLRKLLGVSAATHLVKDPSGAPRLFIERAGVKKALKDAGHEFKKKNVPAEGRPPKSAAPSKSLREIEDKCDRAVGIALTSAAEAPDEETNFLDSIAKILMVTTDERMVLEMCGVSAGGDPKKRLTSYIDKGTAPILRSLIVAMLYQDAPQAVIDILGPEYDVDADVIQIETKAALIAEKKGGGGA